MYCKKCGKEIKGIENFCPYCGEKIENNEEEERKVDEQKLDEQRIEKGQSNEENNQSVKQSHKVKTRKQFTVGKIIGIAAMLVIIGIGIYSQVKDEAPVDPSKKQEEKKNTAQDKKTDTKAKADKKTDNIDVEQYFDKSGKELEKIGFKKDDSGKYENEDGSIVIEMKDDAVNSISMNSECKSEFHGIKIGDEREKIEKAFGDTYPLIGTDEGGDIYGNIDKKVEIEIKTAQNKIRTIMINLDFDLSGYEDPDAIFTDYPGIGGTYYDSDTGERLVIAEVGYEYAYTYYLADGSIADTATECSGNFDDENNIESIWSDDPTKHGIEKREDGGFEISSGVGQPWGNFRKISGTDVITTNFEGTYKNRDDSIVIYKQATDFDNDNIPGGSDIAEMYVSYNGGSIINGILYTQGGDGTVAIIDETTGEPRGIITFEDGKIVVTGSMFDGTFKLTK